MNKLALAQIDANMTNFFWQHKKNKIASLKLPLRNISACSYLIIGGTRQSDAKDIFVNRHHKPGAISPLPTVTTPLIRGIFPMPDFISELLLNISGLKFVMIRVCTRKSDTAYDKKTNDLPGPFYPRGHSLILAET